MRLRQLHLRILLLCTTLALAGMAHAERAEHFKGKPTETLEQAVKNFSEYNHKLEAILVKGSLTAQDLAEIHQLTYTLENALEKINDELSELAEVLEEVHVASEMNDAETVLSRGDVYLSISRQVIR